MNFKRIVYLLVFCFCSHGASVCCGDGLAPECFYEAPPPKRAKLSGHFASHLVSYRRDSTETLDALYAVLTQFADKSYCHYRILEQCMKKKGKTAVLWQVLDLAFKRNLTIFYDEDVEVYFYSTVYERPKEPGKHCTVVIAEEVLKNKDIHASSGADIALKVYSLGYRFDSAYHFKRIFAAVKMICCKFLPGRLRVIKMYADFLEKEDECRDAFLRDKMFFSKMREKFNFRRERSETVQQIDEAFAREVFFMNPLLRQTLEVMAQHFSQTGKILVVGPKACVESNEQPFGCSGIGSPVQNPICPMPLAPSTPSYGEIPFVVKSIGIPVQIMGEPYTRSLPYFPQASGSRVVNGPGCSQRVMGAEDVLFNERYALKPKLEKAQKFENFIQKTFKDYQSKGVWCDCAAFRARSEYLATMDIVMDVVFVYGYSIHYCEESDTLFVLPEGEYHPPLDDPVEYMIADCICHPRRKFSLWEVASRVHEGGYKFVSFDDFRIKYTGVRLILDCFSSVILKKLREFVFYLRANNVQREKIFNEMVLYENKHNFAVGRVGYEIVSYITSLSEKIFDTVQEKGRLAIIPSVRRIKNPYSNRGVMRQVQQCINSGDELHYTKIRRECLNTSTSVVIGLKSVLNCVFKAKCGVTYNAISQVYRFTPKKECAQKPYVPAEVVLSFACFGGHISTQEGALWGLRLYNAGYDFNEYEEYEDMFGAVCIVRDLNTVRFANITRCQKFWESIRPWESERTLYEQMQYYRENRYAIKDEDAVLLKYAKELKSRNIFEGYPEGIKNVEACDLMVEKILKEQAKNDVSCYWRILALVMPFDPDEVTPEKVLGFVMNMVFAKKLNILYDRATKHYMWLDSPQLCKKPQESIWKFTLKNLQESSWVESDHAYALYAAGYDAMSLRRVEGMLGILKSYYSSLFVHKESVLRCKIFFGLGEALKEMCKLDKLFFTDSEQAFVKDCQGLLETGRLSFEDIKELMCVFSGEM